jgi:leader peptidase (prepilin peptidase)/N-methyltransferase
MPAVVVDEARRDDLKEMCIFAFLAWNSWKDIRKHEISLPLTLVFGIGGLILSWQNHETFGGIAGSASIGLGMMGMSILTRGGVGMGDGLLLLALSGFLSAEELLMILLLGLFLCAVWGAILFLLRKKERHTEIPFIPFLSLGYLGGIMLW